MNGFTAVYVGLGSNIGNRKLNIKKALKFLSDINDFFILKTSSLYETSAIGPSQRSFINCVIKAKTKLDPHELLKNMQKIEKTMGRQKTVKWGPRIMDLDILLYGKTVIKSENLTIPHKEMEKRLFVLDPLSEISPKLIHPVIKQTVSKLKSCIT
ncbi:2-amino-4-hydroxy-6-hydroxymethyldihydropteridine diphosphokinase [Elusimicrobiota bacterium]